MPHFTDLGPAWTRSWASLGMVQQRTADPSGYFAYLHEPSGALGLINCKYSNFNWIRTISGASRPATGVVAVFLVTAGEARFGTAGESCHCLPGEGFLLDMDQDFHFGNEILTTTETCVLLLPRARVPVASTGLRKGLRFSSATLCGGLFVAALGHLSARMPSIEPAGLAPLAATLTSLVTAMAGELSGPHVRWGRELRMNRIMTFIDANLASQQLEPDMIAGHFAMSRATLYRMFEPLGGVAGFIRERRLSRAMADLSSPGSPSRSIAAAGRKAGYPDSATFSRAFRARFGLSPAEAARLRSRKALPTDNGEAPAAARARMKTLADYLADIGAARR